jgi:hypothetical protein
MTRVDATRAEALCEPTVELRRNEIELSGQ